MSYNSHTWVDGETITAPKLNNMEQGIASANAGGSSGGGVLIATADNEGTLDKTWQEIYDADFAVIKVSMGSGIVKLIYIDQIGSTGDDYYYITTTTDTLSTNSASGYPQLEEGGGGGPTPTPA